MVKRVKKRILQGIVLAVILTAVYYPGYRRLCQAKDRSARLRIKMNTLIARNKVLEKKLELLNSDMVYIEKRAREKLGIAGKGEVLYEFVPRDEPQAGRHKSGR